MHKTIQGTLFVAFLTFGQTALAYGNWINNGTQLTYVYPNQLRVGYGTVSFNGTQLEAGGVTMSPSTTPPVNVQWATKSGSATCPYQDTEYQAASSAYYIYAQEQDGATGLIVSPVPPLEAGYPQDDLQVYVGQPGEGGYCYTGIVNTTFVFLGSYLTDSGNNVVAFERTGEQVIFSGAQNSTSASITNNGVVSWAPSSYYPSSASALIIDVQARSSDAAHDHTLFFEDPILGRTSCSSGGDYNLSALSLFSGSLGHPATMGARVVAVTNGSDVSYTLAMCDTTYTSGQMENILLKWMGYIEPVHHMNQNRFSY